MRPPVLSIDDKRLLRRVGVRLLDHAEDLQTCWRCGQPFDEELTGGFTITVAACGMTASLGHDVCPEGTIPG